MFDDLFKFADTNGDGAVSFQEFQNMLSKLPSGFDFGSLDANGDGEISLSEFMNGTSGMPAAFDFNALDTNGDGILSVEECSKMFADFPLRFDFSAADIDGDGRLSMEEFMNAAANVAQGYVSGHELQPDMNYAPNISFGGSGSYSCGYTYLSSEAKCLCLGRNMNG